MLILGGIVLLFVDRLPLKPRYHEIMTTIRCRSASASGCSSAWRWSPACRARAPPSSARCCSAPTSARRRSSPSSSPCRPCSAPSSTTSGPNSDTIDAGGAERHRHRLRRRVPLGAGRRAELPRLRQPARLRAVRLVADRRRRGRAARSPSSSPLPEPATTVPPHDGARAGSNWPRGRKRTEIGRAGSPQARAARCRARERPLLRDRGLRDDIVDLELADLVGGEQLSRQVLEDRSRATRRAATAPARAGAAARSPRASAPGIRGTS